MASPSVTIGNIGDNPFRNVSGPTHYSGVGAGISVLTHALAAGIILFLAYLAHIHSLEQLMLQNSLPNDGPAAALDTAEVIPKDKLPPIPATKDPEFVIEIEIPKPTPLVVIPPPPKPKPKPVVVAKETPRYTAPHATGSGRTATVAKLVVGSGGFPSPHYPMEAEIRHQSGTVVVTIEFNSDGGVSNVNVIESSGVSSLDSNAEEWISDHWQNPSFAGRTVTVPINYHLRGI